jgi:uncharacterized membrane protein
MIYLLLGIAWTVVILIVPLLALRQARQASERVERLSLRILELEARLRAQASPAPASEAPSAPREVQVSAPPPPGLKSRPTEAAATAPGLEARPARETDDSLERRIGARWLLYLGVGAVVIGAAYFVKLAFDNQWINATTRVLIGAAGGAVLIAAGLRFVRAGYQFYGQVLAGGGLAVLYLSAYAAFTFYGLVERLAAFGLLAAITALAAAVADVQRSQALALAAVSGGFLTPFLIGGGTASPTPLFTYNAVLVAGTLYLARRREWPALHIVSLVLTFLSLTAWASRYYTRDRYLEVELFLTLFCAMFLYILRENWRSKHPHASIATFVLLAAPIAYHVASLTILGPHRPAFLVYVIASTVAGVIAGVRLNSAPLRLVVWLGVLLPMIGWVDDVAARWNVAAVSGLLAIYGSHLLAQREAQARRSTHSGAETAIAHLNGLGFFAAVYTLLADEWVAWMAAIAVTLAMGNGAIAWMMRRAGWPLWLHYLSVALTLAAAATALQFDGAWLTLAWGVEGTAVVWIALRERREWLRRAGLLLLAVAAARLFDTLVSPVSATHIALFNSRTALAAALIAALYFLARLHRLTPHLGPGGRQWRARFLVLANAATLVALTAEIDAYFFARDAEAFRGGPTVASARTLSVVREMSRSIAWTAYAVALIAIGIRRRYAPLRYLAIAVVGVTLLKVFLVDLAELDRIYRVLTFIIVGVLLLLASYLYQRHTTAGAPEVPTL